jgi:DNA-binding NarL/FixJ family response regulator
MANEITVLIADDHPIFRRGLREVIEAEPRLRLLTHVEDGEAAWELIQRDVPQVAVLDIDMPRMDGLAVARAVKDAGLPVAVVLLTMHRNERLFNSALDLGVDGFVLKDSAVTEIVTAIEAAAAGNNYVTPLLMEFLINRHREPDPGTGRLGLLTEAERRVLAGRRLQDQPRHCERAVHQRPHRRAPPRQHRHQARSTRHARVAAVRHRAQGSDQLGRALLLLDRYATLHRRPESLTIVVRCFAPSTVTWFARRSSRFSWRSSSSPSSFRSPL